MLLGPGREHLADRQHVATELIELGYKNIVLMEHIDDSLTDKSLEGKFNRIITNYGPRFFIAFFYNDARMDGVTFELGWLCHMYQSSGLTRNLLLLLENGYNWNQTTPYVPSLLPGVLSNQFDESQDYSKASKLIHKFVLNLS